VSLIETQFAEPMKLLDALKITQSPPEPEARPLEIYFVCGFTPLHVQTFLAAHLRLLCADRRIQVHTGLYGDFLGNLDRAAKSNVQAVVIALEWPDLDPRLGIRAAGNFAASREDIEESARKRMDRIRKAIQDALPHATVALSLPTLPARAVCAQPGWHANGLDAVLSKCIAEFAVWATQQKNIRLLSSQRLDELSPSNGRWDLRAELSTGFPYTLHHAAILGCLLSRLIQPPAPKKGIITDLDDTVWDGIVGEVGVNGISWNLERNTHVHALYQQQLSALAGAGILVAVASKNEPDVVRQAFERSDLLLPANQVFPIEATWGPKSAAVRRILDAWNVGPDSVVFIDDSPMELAEVQAAFPDIECIAFPKHDPQGVVGLLNRLRDLFGKHFVSEEDTLRLNSLRRVADFGKARQNSDGPTDDFLEDAGAEITFEIAKDPSDPRTLELINKTNQFNLNGRRYTEAEWKALLADPESHLLVASYKDKYGQLGKIAILGARSDGRKVLVDTWVMSCRAFSRRIEQQCLRQLFTRFATNEISFDFQPTPRNLPLQEFFTALLGSKPQGRFTLSHSAFEEKCPRLFHTITIKDAKNERSGREIDSVFPRSLSQDGQRADSAGQHEIGA
jgi:FkbH-like protein